jgi:hypothetical protein
MKPEPAYTIRAFRASDRAAVRRLCCQTGFLGTPIDPVYEDRELFADFLTTYYTDHEPESSFVLEVDGELKGYLLGSRKPLLNQLYSFQQNLVLFLRVVALSTLQSASRRFIRWRSVTAGVKPPRHAAHRIFISTCCRSEESLRRER